jgi:hypothetical protein
MHITTGYELGCHGDPAVQGGRSELNRDTIFSSGSNLEQPFSRRVIVLPGTAAMFTCYALPEGRSVETWQVVVGRDTEGAGSDFYMIKMSLGAPASWLFTQTFPQKIITLPGTYRFRLSDPDILHSEDFVMDRVVWRLEDTPVGALVVC